MGTSFPYRAPTHAEQWSTRPMAGSVTGLRSSFRPTTPHSCRVLAPLRISPRPARQRSQGPERAEGAGGLTALRAANSAPTNFGPTRVHLPAPLDGVGSPPLEQR